MKISKLITLILFLLSLTITQCRKMDLNQPENYADYSSLFTKIGSAGSIEEGLSLYFKNTHGHIVISTSNSIYQEVHMPEIEREFGILGVIHNTYEQNDLPFFSIDNINVEGYFDNESQQESFNLFTPYHIDRNYFVDLFNSQKKVFFLKRDQTTIFQDSLFVPLTLKVTAPINQQDRTNTINVNDEIIWNADNSNENGVLILLSETRGEQRTTNYRWVEDNGKFVLDNTMFQNIEQTEEQNQVLKLRVMRGNFGIYTGADEKEYRIIFYTESFQYYDYYTD